MSLERAGLTTRAPFAGGRPQIWVPWRKACRARVAAGLSRAAGGLIAMTWLWQVALIGKPACAARPFFEMRRSGLAQTAEAKPPATGAGARSGSVPTLWPATRRGGASPLRGVSQAIAALPRT